MDYCTTDKITESPFKDGKERKESFILSSVFMTGNILQRSLVKTETFIKEDLFLTFWLKI